ncbi:MAG: hypothetical protein KGL36_02990 [Gammaproteobacteria bacterium]|nr:hypothetical protein [Gammaproteobacteria bacterium]
MDHRLLAALVAGAALIGSGIAPANADMTLRQYQPYLRRGHVLPAAIRNYVDGLGTGFVWANAYELARKRPAIFCSPQLKPGGDYVAMLDGQITHHPGVRAPYAADTTLAMILLDALVNEFPCKDAPAQ